METVSCVVLNWRQPEATLRCIASLRDQQLPGGWRLDVVLVDNASADGWFERLSDAADRALLLDENGGYAAGNNAGIEAALESGSDVVVVVNNDATLDAGCLSELVEACTPGGQRLVSATVLDEENRPWFSDSVLDPLTCRAVPADGRPGVPFLPGCCLAARADVWRDLLPIPQRLFMYWEDVVLCARAAMSGVDLAVCSAAVCRHSTSLSSDLGGANPFKWFYVTRNRLWALRLGWLPAERSAALWRTPAILAEDVAGIIKSPSPARWREVRTVLLGAVAGLGPLPDDDRPRVSSWRL